MRLLPDLRHATNCFPRRRRRAGLTLVELAVVLGIGTMVFGLVLAALIQTSRASDDLISRQQMRQEALLIGQSVEKMLRFRVDGDQLAFAAPAGGRGGAQPPGAAGGETTGTTASSTLPASLQETLLTTGTAPVAETTAPAPARTPTPDELTSVPATIRPLMMPTTGTASARPNPAPGELYAPDELTVYSPGGKSGRERPLASVRNSRGLPEETKHVFLERFAVGADREPGASRVEKLGVSPDRFQSQVSFRYASEFDGLNARWKAKSAQVPRVIEYTVRVWPVGAGGDFASARDRQTGRPVGFEYAGGVKLP